MSDQPKKITKEEAEAAEAKFLKEQAKKEAPEDEESYDEDDSEHDYSGEDDWMGADSDYDQGGPENRD